MSSQTTAPAMPVERRILRRPEVEAKTGFKRAHIYSLMKDGKFPKAAEPMLSMIEWWICLSMPPDEVEKVARFRELNPAQKALMLSARKESGKFSEGVILSKSMEVLFRAVPPSLYLAMAMTEPEEKAERYQLMRQYGIGELEAAFKVAEKIDRARGIEPLPLDALG